MQEVRQMKKQAWIFIAITGMFICVLIGIFIGRNMKHNYVHMNDSTQAQTQNPTQVTQENDGKININTATEQQLMLLPGVGETTAKKIIEYRTTNNGFNSVEDIMNVSGIGEKKFAQMKPYIKVD